MIIATSRYVEWLSKFLFYFCLNNCLKKVKEACTTQSPHRVKQVNIKYT